MPKEYSVDIQNEEASLGANALSITGMVNGIQCAATVRLSDLTGKAAKDQKRTKQLALIGAFEERVAAPPAASADKVMA